MPAPSLTPQEFVTKWERVTLNEKATAQTHFNELCQLLGQPGPLDADQDGSFYRFEKPLTKVGGRAGFADVWRKDRFAWEYKTKGKYSDLRAAYQQLLLYKEDLDNPPILVACDIANYEVHIAFTGFRTVVRQFTNADLLNADTRTLLRLVLTDPEQLRPTERTETVTEIAAARFARVAQLLEGRGHAPAVVAPFFMKLLFALFAEDIHLLPNQLMTRSIREAIFQPAEFVGRTRALFQAMRVGGYFGIDRVPQFNGGLFDDDDVLALNADELQFLADAARLDWSQVEPAIFGTLFERSLDPSKRAQLGAHYTSRADILLIVEPVLMQPLRRDWEHVKTGIEALREQWASQSGNARRRLMTVADGMLLDFMERLAQIRLLDPACGSGNFLYVSLNALKDLEKAVLTYATGVGLTLPELGVTPAQFYGIEKNQFAAELAQVVIWIGYLQWKRTNGFWDYAEPILQTLDTIQCRDAILAYDADGNPVEPEWPAADVIISNPPFLGWYKLRQELGDTYVNALFSLYDGRVPGGADLVCYWFERARMAIEISKAGRAGLLATNSIRSGANRKVVDRIKQSGDIFLAWDDRPWILDGAAVRVSMIGFDDGTDPQRHLNGISVASISADLTSALDLTVARRLKENQGIAFLGAFKFGSFELSADMAAMMLNAPLNPNGQPNSDVVHPWMNGLDITRRPRDMWIINFRDRTEAEASGYELPFEYVRRVVKPERDLNRRPRRKRYWWQHGETSPGLYAALAPFHRFIGTSTVAKYRAFVWLAQPTIPDHALIVFAREDDYFFGVLHSHLHELWSLRMGSWLGVGNDPRYTPTTCFETYPFPWPPGAEPQGDPRVAAIAEAARALVEKRDRWLNPEGADDATLKKRTLTNLYNARPTWLDLAHQQLDRAVLDAYGWPHALTDEEMLARLLVLNLERAAAQGGAAAPSAGDADDAAA